MAEILHQDRGREQWTAQRMGFSYRSSVLKRESLKAVIVSARFEIIPSTIEATNMLLEEYASWRRKTQPPGASMGSMFKNPLGDYAGRLIDQCGLKGTRIGAAEISPVHANFFINHGGASASDILALIRLAQKKVFEEFGIELQLEIDLLGEWSLNETGA
jgi:UDP-N-acetylmuramate dehydrogenase